MPRKSKTPSLLPVALLTNFARSEQISVADCIARLAGASYRDGAFYRGADSFRVTGSLESRTAIRLALSK